MVTVTWEDNKQEVSQLIHTIITELKTEIEENSDIIIVSGGYRIELQDNSELDNTLKTVETIMNKHIENGPDDWLASHTENSISVAIRPLS